MAYSVTLTSFLSPVTLKLASELGPTLGSAADSCNSLQGSPVCPEGSPAEGVNPYLLMIHIGNAMNDRKSNRIPAEQGSF